MACKAPGGSKKKYIYYQCNTCKTYIREDKLVELLIDEITQIIEYDSIVRKHFAPLLKHKIAIKQKVPQTHRFSLSSIKFRYPF